MEFDSFDALADHFLAAERALHPAMVRGLPEAGQAIAAAVKSKFGTYGPGWKPLAEATRDERRRLGFTPDDPLFRSGGLQGLVTWAVDGDGVNVGIPDGATLQGPKVKAVDARKVMDAHEFGTTDGKLPARPTFGQVFFEIDRFAEAYVIGVLARANL